MCGMLFQCAVCYLSVRYDISVCGRLPQCAEPIPTGQQSTVCYIGRCLRCLPPTTIGRFGTPLLVGVQQQQYRCTSYQGHCKFLSSLPARLWAKANGGPPVCRSLWDLFGKSWWDSVVILHVFGTLAVFVSGFVCLSLGVVC